MYRIQGISIQGFKTFRSDERNTNESESQSNIGSKLDGSFPHKKKERNEKPFFFVSILLKTDTFFLFI